MNPFGLSLDAGDYDTVGQRPRNTSELWTRADVPKELLALLPEGSHTFGYIVHDDGQLLIHSSSEPRQH